MKMGKAHGQTTDTLNPAHWENGFTTGMSHGIHGRLTEVAPDGSLIPELAESWEASADASEWRFKIRSGVTFHSGKTLDVQDVINSINHHRGEDSTSAVGPLVADVVDLVAEGNDTVVFKLKGGNADFPFFLSEYHFAICPAKDDGIDWQSGDGCGSYVIGQLQIRVSRRPSRAIPTTGATMWVSSTRSKCWPWWIRTRAPRPWSRAMWTQSTGST